MIDGGILGQTFPICLELVVLLLSVGLLVLFPDNLAVRPRQVRAAHHQLRRLNVDEWPGAADQVAASGGRGRAVIHQLFYQVHRGHEDELDCGGEKDIAEVGEDVQCEGEQLLGAQVGRLKGRHQVGPHHPGRNLGQTGGRDIITEDDSDQAANYWRNIRPLNSFPLCRGRSHCCIQT